MNIRKMICLIIIVFGLMTTASCGPSEIAQKLAERKLLNKDEQSSYEKNKEAYDKEIQEILKEIEETTYKEPTGEERAKGKQVYLLVNGKVAEFDIALKSCEKFGFPAGARVDSKYGKAHVVGVYDKKLWFHFEGKKGADDTRGSDSKEGLMDEGFRIIPEEPKKEPSKNIPQSKPETTPVPTLNATKETESEKKVEPDGSFPPIPPIPPIQEK